jgi:hypothetical protein
VKRALLVSMLAVLGAAPGCAGPEPAAAGLRIGDLVTALRA